MSAKTNTQWQNRIVGYSDEPPDQLLAHSLNWRLHPKIQQDALSGVLNEVGLVQNIICNRRTGNVVDGHLRVALALRTDQPTVPVTWVDLSEEEELLILATIDPIGALAEPDHGILNTLLDAVSTTDPILQGILDGMRTEGEPGDGEVGDGSLLSLMDITIAEPRHKVLHGEVYRLGRHVLVVADVMQEWESWVGYLRPGSILAPYPGPFVAIGVVAQESDFVLVQPDVYLAGHVLDRYADIHGEDSITREATHGD